MCVGGGGDVVGENNTVCSTHMVSQHAGRVVEGQNNKPQGGSCAMIAILHWLTHLPFPCVSSPMLSAAL
jgi:hypothetical protein